MIGADGFAGGRAIRLVLDRTDYELRYISQVDGSSGFAGNFVSDGTYAYRMDTAGRLWGVHLGRKTSPNGWTDNVLNIFPDIGVAEAFTNTDPVVVPREEGTYLCLTLRNYIYPGTPDSALRDGETGNDGAVGAIGPNGQVEWYRHFGPQDRDGQGRINTTALAIPSSNGQLGLPLSGDGHRHLGGGGPD